MTKAWKKSEYTKNVASRFYKNQKRTASWKINSRNSKGEEEEGGVHGEHDTIAISFLFFPRHRRREDSRESAGRVYGDVLPTRMRDRGEKSHALSDETRHGVGGSRVTLSRSISRGACIREVRAPVRCDYDRIAARDTAYPSTRSLARSHVYFSQNEPYNTLRFRRILRLWDPPSCFCVTVRVPPLRQACSGRAGACTSFRGRANFPVCQSRDSFPRRRGSIGWSRSVLPNVKFNDYIQE